MTDANYTHIELVVDASGSMAHLTNDTVKGITSLVDDQVKAEGRATVSYTTFNTYPMTHLSLRPVNEAGELPYRAGGGTALLDAVGRRIIELGRVLGRIPAEQRPANVVFVIVTDGEENSSKAYNRAQIKELIETQQSVYSWNFIFMGANVDAFHEASTLGIYEGSTVQFAHNQAGTQGTYASASSSILRGRSAASHGLSGAALMSSYNFTEQEREQAEGEQIDPNAPLTP